MPRKTIIVANDMVGIGKVALTIALPILSACQIEAIPLPTVLLSSHTGGFEKVYAKNLTEEMGEILDVWEKLNYSPDGLLTGYFKSSEQMNLLLNFSQKKGLRRFVDPIMGDKGHLYSGFDDNFVINMRHFCYQAEVIIPNLTEAALLTNSPYLGEKYSIQDIEQLLKKLAVLEVKHIILTGVSIKPGEVGFAHFDASNDKISYYMSHKFAEHFYGTGDLLTAILGAAYFHKLDFGKMAELSLTFINRTLKTTLECQNDLRYGLLYESHLNFLTTTVSHLLEEKHEKSLNTSTN